MVVAFVLAESDSPHPRITPAVDRGSASVVVVMAWCPRKRASADGMHAPGAGGIGGQADRYRTFDIAADAGSIKSLSCRTGSVPPSEPCRDRHLPHLPMIARTGR
jgi:hypothetical protein